MKYSIAKRLAFVFVCTFALGTGLALAWSKSEREPKVGGVRALGALPKDYRPLQVPEIRIEPLTQEVRAEALMHDMAERDGFSTRSVLCQRRMGADYCSICYDHPKHYLGGALVRCHGAECVRVEDVGEEERVGWNAEWACGLHYVGKAEWNPAEE